MRLGCCVVLIVADAQSLALIPWFPLQHHVAEKLACKIVYSQVLKRGQGGSWVNILLNERACPVLSGLH